MNIIELLLVLLGLYLVYVSSVILGIFVIILAIALFGGFNYRGRDL